MLHSAKALQGFQLLASDGEAGTVKDLYFDAHSWTIRYLVVDTGGWLDSRLVLISPHSILGMDASAEAFQTNLSREQIRNSPDIDTDKPVSRQYETEYFDYYGYPYYWAGPQLWGASTLPVAGGSAAGVAADTAGNTAHEHAGQAETGDPSLHSVAEVEGYSIRATDDSFGHVEDFLIDDRDWAISLIVADTRSWLPSTDVLLSPRRITRVEWLDKFVEVSASRAEIENSPQYDSNMLAEQQGYGDLYLHAGRNSEMPERTRASRGGMKER